MSRRGLHVNDVGHSGPACGMLSRCATEKVQVGAENEGNTLAKSNTQAAQGTLKPGTFGDAAGVRSQVSQIVEELMG